MRAPRLLLDLLLFLLLLSSAAVLLALVHAYQLRGEWSAIIMIGDAAVLAYAGFVALFGWSLRRALRDTLSRSAVAWLTVWSLLGPLPIAFYSIFHWLKLLS